LYELVPSLSLKEKYFDSNLLVKVDLHNPRSMKIITYDSLSILIPLLFVKKPHPFLWGCLRFLPKKDAAFLAGSIKEIIIAHLYYNFINYIFLIKSFNT